MTGSIECPKERVRGRWEKEIEEIKNKKNQESGASLDGKQHRFQPLTFHTPTYCVHCLQLLVGVTKQGVVCSDCGFPCHERCQDLITVNCKDVVRSLDEWQQDVKDRKAQVFCFSSSSSSSQHFFVNLLFVDFE